MRTSPARFVAGACVAVGFSAAAAPRAVESPQLLLLEAVHAGRAEGVIVGPIARTFAELFRTDAPLRYTVQTAGDLGGGCRRLEVSVEQDGVRDRNSTTVSEVPEPRRLTYLVSMCADGSPPPAASTPPPPEPARAAPEVAR